MVHAFTCAGILPTQFIKLCTFADIGTVKHGYISQGSLLIVMFMALVFVFSV